MNCKAKEVLPFFLKTKDNNNSQAFKTKKKLNLVCKKLRKHVCKTQNTAYRPEPDSYPPNKKPNKKTQTKDHLVGPWIK